MTPLGIAVCNVGNYSIFSVENLGEFSRWYTSYCLHMHLASDSRLAFSSISYNTLVASSPLFARVGFVFFVLQTQTPSACGAFSRCCGALCARREKAPQAGSGEL